MDLCDINANYQMQGGEFWLAVKDDEVIGTIGLMLRENSCAILKKFFIKKEYRGQKIGYALYRQLLEYANNKSIKYIILDTPSIATSSHRFYEKVGFKKITKKDLPINYEFPDRNSVLYILSQFT